MHLILHCSRIVSWLTQAIPIPSISLSGRIPILGGEKCNFERKLFSLLPLYKVEPWDPLRVYEA